MPEREPISFSFENGYWPTTALIKGIPNCIIAGQNLWARGKGLFTSSKGFGAAVASSGGVNPLLNVANGYGGLTGGGSITQAFAAGVYFFAGIGSAIVNGTILGAVQGGTVTIYTGSSVVQAGLTLPGAPTIADSGAAGRNSGTYSIAVTAIRSITGGESTVSLPSNTISVTNHGIMITALPGFPAGANMVGIYVTKRGFGDIGPYFHLYDVAKTTVDAGIAGGGYVIQIPGASQPGWIDTQLTDLAPLDFSVPPTCTHCFSINAVIVAAGCYGGAGLSPSYPNKPEAYPTRFVLFIPGGGTITMVKGSGIEGAVLVGTISSLTLVSASQSTISPLNIEPIWPTTGVLSANQICTVGAEIFAWLGTRGPIRDSLASRNSDPGDESTAFAEPVMKTFQANGFNASNVTVVYDPASDTVWYVKGAVAVGYCRYLRQWHLPHVLPASIVTAVTDNASGRALLSDSGGNLYAFETGSGGSWNLITQFQGSNEQFAFFPMTVIGLRGLVGGSCRGDLYTNMDINTPHSQATNKTMAANHGDPHPLNVQSVNSVALGLSGTDAGGTEVYGADALKEVHPVRI